MRILIVEDEPAIARRTERYTHALPEDRNPNITISSSRAEAQLHLQQTPIDLLILDLNLHGQDGFELLKSVVAGSFHTIIISAHTDQALRAFEFGVLDFIGKPFTQDRLAVELHNNTRLPVGRTRYKMIQKKLFSLR